MKILFAGNKARGIYCLHAVKDKHKIAGVIGNKKTNLPNDFIKEAIQLGFDTFQPEDINNLNFIDLLVNLILTYQYNICYDINLDETINIIDVIMVINIILS